MGPREPAVLGDREVEELLDYSCSIPTGTTIGKRWKRLEPYVIPKRGAQCRYLGEYVDIGDPERVGIRWAPLITATEAGELAAAIMWWLA